MEQYNCGCHVDYGFNVRAMNMNVNFAGGTVKGGGNQSFLRIAVRTAGARMGVAAHQPAASSQWRNRSEVLFGIVKAGRVVRRNSLQMDTGMAGL